MLKNLFASRWGMIGTGVLIGVLAPLLQKLGNPGNMGICVACFERDIAGAVGLHRAAVVSICDPRSSGSFLVLLPPLIFLRSFDRGPAQLPLCASFSACLP